MFNFRIRKIQIRAHMCCSMKFFKTLGDTRKRKNIP